MKSFSPKKTTLEYSVSSWFIAWEYSTYSNYVRILKGFPQLQIAMISGMGIIKAFPIDGQPYETFPKVQQKKFDESHQYDTHLPL